MKKNAVVAKKNAAKAVQKRTVKAAKKRDMARSVAITYNITNLGKRASAVVQAIAEGLKLIHEATGCRIDHVAINNYRDDVASGAVPTKMDELIDLEMSGVIGGFAVANIYRDGGDAGSGLALDALENLRGLHDELGDLIGDVEDDPEAAASGLEGVHAEMKAQLAALEEALEEES